LQPQWFVVSWVIDPYLVIGEKLIRNVFRSLDFQCESGCKDGELQAPGEQQYDEHEQDYPADSDTGTRAIGVVAATAAEEQK
jgi:hypothetical protein